MGRKFVFERPKMTSITVDLLTAEIIRQYKYTGEPLYRTVNRIMRDHAPPDLVEKCKAKLAAMEKNALARIDRYGQTRQSSLTNDDEKDKPSENYPREWKGMLKADYVDMLAEKYKVKKSHALEEVKRRLKKGALVEHGGYVEEIVNVWS
jgi:hypothetical protein